MWNTGRDRLIDRRTFVRSIAATGAAAVVATGRLPAATLPNQPLTIGMILPQKQDGLLADVRQGIELGFAEAARSALLFQKHVALVTKSFSSPADAAVAVTNLISGERATVLIGGGNDDECRLIANACIARRALFVNAVSRSDDLRRSLCSAYVFHVEASDAMYAAAMSLAASGDGTGGAETQCSIVEWDASLERYGASQLNDRYRAKASGPMTGPSWAGWMAVKAVTESYFRSGASDGDSIAGFMSRDTTQFDGHKGAALSFRSWDHQLRQPLYCVSKAAPGGPPAIRDVPDLARSPGSARELLDRLGDTESSSRCASPKR